MHTHTGMRVLRARIQHPHVYVILWWGRAQYYLLPTPNHMCIVQVNRVPKHRTLGVLVYGFQVLNHNYWFRCIPHGSVVPRILEMV